MLARIGREAEPRSGARRSRRSPVPSLRRLAEDDLEGITSDELYALATSAFAFAESRGLEASAVRVFNADPDTHGYRCHGTVIEVVTDDSPFLVDSISEELTARGLTIKRLLHPVIGADPRRAGAARRGAVGPGSRTPRVLHALRGRSRARRRRDRRAREARPSDPPRRLARGPGLRSDAGARPAHDRAGARRRGELPARGRRRGRQVPRLAPPAELRPARLPRVRAAGHEGGPRDPGGSRQWARDPVGRREVDVLGADPALGLSHPTSGTGSRTASS